MNERAHRERRYHSDGEVRIIFNLLYLVLFIDDVQFRVYGRGDIQLLNILETREIYANGQVTKQVYAAEIEQRAVTVIKKRIRSETTDETVGHGETRISMDDGVPPADLTVLKRLWYTCLFMYLLLSIMLIRWQASKNCPAPRLFL